MQGLLCCVLVLLLHEILAARNETSSTEGAKLLVATEQELQDAFHLLQTGQSVELKTKSLQLNSTLLVRASNVSLQGHANGSIIRCLPNASALEIHASITISDIDFVDCAGRPAVKIAPSPELNVFQIEAHFRNVRFFGNGGDGALGGAIVATGGFTDVDGQPCLPRVVIDGCEFDKNKAHYGGAISCHFCHLTIINSQFHDNRAHQNGTGSGGAVFISNKPLDTNRVKRTHPEKAVIEPKSPPAPVEPVTEPKSPPALVKPVTEPKSPPAPVKPVIEPKSPPAPVKPVIEPKSPPASVKPVIEPKSPPVLVKPDSANITRMLDNVFDLLKHMTQTLNLSIPHDAPDKGNPYPVGFTPANSSRSTHPLGSSSEITLSPTGWQSDIEPKLISNSSALPEPSPSPSSPPQPSPSSTSTSFFDSIFSSIQHEPNHTSTPSPQPSPSSASSRSLQSISSPTSVHFRNPYEVEFMSSSNEESSAVKQLSSSNESVSSNSSLGLQPLTPTLSFLIQNCRFDQNQASEGGAISVHYEEFHESLDQQAKLYQGKIFDCFFEENTANFSLDESLSQEAHMVGGAISIVSSVVDFEWSLKDSAFLNNKARYGGALHLMAHRVKIEPHIEYCVFRGNQAEKAGGGIMGRNQISVNLLTSHFSRNDAEYGGAIALTDIASMNLGYHSVSTEEFENTKCCFVKNSATNGGAVAAIRSGNVAILSSEFKNNIAKEAGGAAYFSRIEADIGFFNVMFLKNVALRGGGVAVETTRSFHFGDLVRKANVSFLENFAVAGAGLSIQINHQDENNIHLSNALFQKNSAREMVFTNDGEEVPVAISPCGNGGGGGLCLVWDLLLTNTATKLFLSDLSLVQNSALLGAGMFVQLPSQAHNSHKTNASCSQPSFFRDTCEDIRFANLSFDENVAVFGGGGFHLSDPSRVYVGCASWAKAEDFIPILSAVHTYENYCMHFKNNTVLTSGGVFGQNISSPAHAIQRLHPDESITDLAAGEKILPSCRDCNANRASGILIAVKDFFNQTVTGGLPDAYCHLRLISSHIAGQSIYEAENGIFNINNTIAIGVQQTNTLVMIVDEHPDFSIQLDFSTRACRPGEFEADGRCLSCELETYSFNSSVECKDCLNHAYCPGKAALVPEEEYWHSSPFSTQFHRCIVKEACVYKDRSPNLTAYYHNTSRLTQDLMSLEMSLELRDFENYNQCSKGYKGVICASCEQEYGRLAGGYCAKCPESRRTSITSTLFLVFWILLLLSLNLLTTLLSTSQHIEMAKYQHYRQGYSALGPSSSYPHHQAEAAQIPVSHGAQHSGDAGHFDAKALEQMLPSGDFDHIVALESLTETFKILINYLQVTSTALSIDVSWLYSIKLFLKIISSPLNVMSGWRLVPFDCVLHNGENDIPKSLIAVWMRIFLPLVFLVVILILVQITCFLFGRKNSENLRPSGAPRHRSAVTYSIVVVLVLIYFFYMDLTSNFLRAVNCARIDKDDKGEMEYQQYAIANGTRFWIEDTELECFAGKHHSIGVLGIVGLAAFSVGGIIIFGVWLLANKDHTKNTHFLARYGFLYSRYRSDRNIALVWECLVFTRKALIAVIVVFAVQSRAPLQLILAVGVLIPFLAAHVYIRPFHYHGENLEDESVCEEEMGSSWNFLNTQVTLNMFETMSMICTISLFYSGVIVHDSNTPEWGKWAITIVALSLNCAFVLLSLCRIYVAAVTVVETHLEVYASPTAKERKGSRNPITFIYNILTLCSFCVLKHKRDRGLEENENLEPVV